MEVSKIEILFGGKNIIIETGRMAKQANGAVLVTCGGTTVLVAVCMSPDVKEGTDFFPLMVEYQEKAYAAGKIPGGFPRREGRPTQKEILTSRIIDRPIRPLFPEGFYNDVVVTCNVISSDGENDPDVLATLGASMALHISDIPYDGPIGPARICLLNDEFVINPTYAQRKESPLEMFIVGMEKGVVMIEGEGKEVAEDKVVEALRFAEKAIQPLIQAQNDFRQKVGKLKTEVQLFKPHADLKKKIGELAGNRLAEAYQIADKVERETALRAVVADVLSDMTVFDAYKVNEQDVSSAHVRMMLDQVEYDVVRQSVFEKQKRADGRSPKELRQITCEVDVLPRTHGSSLFTRGQTQSLSVVTLGSKRDEKLEEGLLGVEYVDFMLHYNFPGFSVGEAKGSRGPGRREIGHGALAAKAIAGILPAKEDFPYTIRIVSEILESNGSSSMASVCAGCLSLMDAGVPIKNPVAGISIGLMTGEKNQYSLLTDIMGLEDHFGDMDFKVAGSRSGVTAIQLDLKIQGVSVDILAEALGQSRDARLKILDNMASVIAKPNADLKEFAPRIVVTNIPPEKIGEVIGPGGKMIKKIMEETKAESIDINDDGSVFVAGIGRETVDRAVHYIQRIIEDPVVGKIYDAKVMKVANFGAFCEFLPGRQGLVHVSEFSSEYVKDLSTVVKVGDTFKVKLVEIDKMKRMNLSKKQAE